MGLAESNGSLPPGLWLRSPAGDQLVSSTKLTKKRGSKFGALLWRHLTPQRKTAIQVHNYNPSCIQLLKKDFGKFTSCRAFGAHKLVHSELFWTTFTYLSYFSYLPLPFTVLRSTCNCKSIDIGIGERVFACTNTKIASISICGT